MSVSNRIQLRRTPTPGNVPLLADLLVGEMAVNLADDNMYYSDGNQVVQLNAAQNIRTDPNNRFVTDALIASWNTPYVLPVSTSTVLGGVKIGSNVLVDVDGTIHLDLASAANNGVLTSADWSTFNAKQDALGYVPVNQAGDTMVGELVLNGAAPVSANAAVSKSYVTGLNDGAVQLAGSTMTGLLVLSGDPLAGLGAATKQYVDTAVNLIAGEYAPPVQDIAALTALVSTTLQDKQMRLVENSDSIFLFNSVATEAADGVNVIMPVDAPASGRWIKIQAATQNHNALNGLQGGALNDYLHLTTAEKNGYDTHLADVVIHMTAAESAWLAAINATATEVNYLVGVTSSVQTQLNGKEASLGYVPVNVAGDTMLGSLTLSGDPTSALMPVTLQYLQSYVVDGGAF